MSKLSERMRRATRAESRPVGLVVTTAAPQQTMLVIAETDAKNAAKATESADALLLPDDAGDGAIKDATKFSVPVGVRLATGSRDRVAALRGMGVDFVVLTEESAASSLMEDELSYILEVPEEPTDTDLRALDALPLEALLAPPVQGPLTIRRSVNLRRFVTFARRPLMLPVEAEIDAADLEALRELNVILLLTPASTAADLREKVAALPPRRQRRTDRGVGVPSFMFGSRAGEPGEDDGHEDE